MNDILVFSPSREQHTKDIAKVLSALSSNNLKLKPSKCEFYKDQVLFLGNLILKDGHDVCPDKLRAIKEWGVPRTTTKLRSFLGSINFLRRFCKDISAVAAPLTALCGDAPFTWDTAQQIAFDQIKETLITAPVLAHPNLANPFIVETDTSKFASRVVLLQTDEKGVDQPLCYFSCKMTPAKTNYPIYDKELLAIVAAFGEWQHYLMYAWHKVTIRTDHKALEYHKSPQRMNQRQTRWHLDLSQYNFTIEYKPGKLNIIPDILSRDPILTFSPQALNQFNTGTMLPPHRFALLHGNYQSFWDKVLASQAASSLGRRIMASNSKGNLVKVFTAFIITHGKSYIMGSSGYPMQIYS